MSGRTINPKRLGGGRLTLHPLDFFALTLSTGHFFDFYGIAIFKDF